MTEQGHEIELIDEAKRVPIDDKTKLYLHYRRQDNEQRRTKRTVGREMS